MSRVAVYTIQIEEDLYEDDTAIEVARETVRRLINEYYRRVTLLGAREMILPPCTHDDNDEDPER